MALTADQITAQNFKDFYGQIRPYLNGAAHSGFTPIGTIIAVMGNAAPLNYLACNGQTVNIADYSELATYFNAQFGSVNFFGGDGTTTFGIPDLRGEFLRGTGTNSHANQGSGANVGVHQNATESLNLQTTASNIQMLGDSESTVGSANFDSQYKSGTGDVKWHVATATSNSTSNTKNVVTSRPTNTSVLYCIATKNIFMDAGSNYSTEEQVVGTWIDGKPVYQKVFTATMPSSIIDGTVSAKRYSFSELGITNLETLAYSYASAFSSTVIIPIPVTYPGSDVVYFARYTFEIESSKRTLYLASNRNFFENIPITFIIQYTKTTDV